MNLKIVHSSKNSLIIEYGSFFEWRNFQWKKLLCTLDKRLDKITLERKVPLQPLQIIHHHLSEIEDVTISTLNGDYGNDGGGGGIFYGIAFRLADDNLTLPTHLDSFIKVEKMKEEIKSFLKSI